VIFWTALKFDRHGPFVVFGACMGAGRGPVYGFSELDVRFNIEQWMVYSHAIGATLGLKNHLIAGVKGVGKSRACTASPFSVFSRVFEIPGL
jgi:hypothetical protein